MKVTFKLSAKAITNLLLQGESYRPIQTIDVDFAEISQEDRDLLIKFSQLDVDTNSLLITDSNNYLGSRIEEKHSRISNNDYEDVTYEAVIKELDIWEKAKREKDENEKIQFQQDVVAFCDGKKFDIFGKSLYSDYSGGLDEKDAKGVAEQYIVRSKDRGIEPVHSEALEVRLQEILAIKQQRKEAKEKTEREAKEKAEKEAKEKKEMQESLQKWGEENGSTLVKLRMEEGMNYKSLLEEEYEAYFKQSFFGELNEEFTTSTDFEDEEELKEYPIQNANIEQIESLRKYRALYPKAEEVRLCRVKYQDEQEEIIHRDFIAIKVMMGFIKKPYTFYTFLNNYQEE